MEKLYGDHTHAHLRGMINSVIFRDEDQTGEFIEAIGNIDGGCEALIDYLSDRDEEIVHFATYGTFNPHHTEEGDEIDRSEASDRDWKELIWLLKHEHADMFEQIWPTLKAMMLARQKWEKEQMALEEQGVEGGQSRVDSSAQKQKVPVDPLEESAL
jgi:hypothetical protein